MNKYLLELIEFCLQSVNPKIAKDRQAWAKKLRFIKFYDVDGEEIGSATVEPTLVRFGDVVRLEAEVKKK